MPLWMLSQPALLLWGFLLICATHLGAYVAGWLDGAESEREVWRAEKAALFAAAEERAQTLRERGDRLAAELELARAEVRTVYVDRIRTVYRVASATRSCLSAETTAALNRQPIRETVERPGEPPRQAAPPPTAGTSELAAAEWIAGAQAAHEQCRAQVSGLVEWIKAPTAGRPL